MSEEPEKLPLELQGPVMKFETVLDSSTGLRVLEHAIGMDLGGTTASFTCRDHDANQWMKVMQYFILEAPPEWDIFIARRFMRIDRVGKPQVAVAWFISFRCDDADLAGLLEQAGGLFTKADHFRRTGKATPGPGAVDFAVASPVLKPKPAEKPATKPAPKERVPQNELPLLPIGPTPRLMRTTDESGFRKEFRPTGTDHQPRGR